MLRREEIHVIVIDLDIKRCEAIRDELQRWGVERIQCSQYGRQVQKIVSHHPFDLVILGDRFEMGNSQEIYDLLQEHPSTAGAPTLWMAADPSPEEQRIMISKGCCGILRYPIEPQEVRRALADFFRRVRGKELRNRLQDAEFFKDFTNKERNAIAKEAILRRFDAGETILSKGDEARRFYVLLKGSVEVYTRSKSTGAHALVVPAGQPFGELAVLDRNPRSAHCIARTECLALEIGAQILDDNGYALTAKIFASLARSLAHRLRTMNEVNDRMEARLQELEYLSSLSKPLPAPNAPVTSTENYLIPPPCESAEADPDIADELHFDSEDVAEEEAKPLIPAEADLIDHSVQGDDAYDVLQRKITLRSDFILAKLPRALRELFANKLYGYFTGSKLAKMNPQKLWSPKWFAGAVPHLKHSLHLVVCSRDGFRAYEDAYLNLPFSHRIIGLSDTGCTGTFLGDAPSIERYFAKKPLKRALEKDLYMPIERPGEDKPEISYLQHTAEDVGPSTLFLCFDETDAWVTTRVRAAFPEHQILTVVREYSFATDEIASFFTMPEEDLAHGNFLVPKSDWNGQGFYQGQTFFVPDLSPLFRDLGTLSSAGAYFATIGMAASLGPDLSGITWGSKGGAEGAVRAARARFGIRGAQSAQDLADAVSWADE